MLDGSGIGTGLTIAAIRLAGAWDAAADAADAVAAAIGRAAAMRRVIPYFDIKPLIFRFIQCAHPWREIGN
jgi:hypothetical protein